VLTDADLYARGSETLLASWETYARGSPGAAVQRLPGVAAAVFPREPERGVYNNALDAAPRTRPRSRDDPARSRPDCLPLPARAGRGLAKPRTYAEGLEEDGIVLRDGLWLDHDREDGA
jgi:hypothetical protein